MQHYFTCADSAHCISFITENNIGKENSFKMRQKRKLFNIGLTHHYDNINPDDVIFNVSSRSLNDDEKEALSYGLDYSLLPSKLNYVRHFTAFEKLFKLITSQHIFNKVPDSLNSVKSRIKNLALTSYYSFQPKVSSKHKKIIHNIKQLSSDANIIVNKPDKGRGVVVMDKTDYVEKMNNILSDTSKFVKNNSDIFKETVRIEDKVNRFIDKLSKDKIIDADFKKTLRATGSRPGTMYGSPKVHKTGTPLRPVLSTIGTANYKLSKYLVQLLSPVVGNEYSIKDSFHFVTDISNTVNSNYIMASFDVVSLFANIPIEESINIILDLVFENSNLYEGYDRKTFKKLLELCTRDNVFLFNNQLYTQKDSAPMGGCASPTVSDIFLSFHEKIWLNNCPSEFKPVKYHR